MSDIETSLHGAAGKERERKQSWRGTSTKVRKKKEPRWRTKFFSLFFFLFFFH
jgi:hypothetical protein